MAQAIQEDRVTPADELRSLLTESEKLVANVPNSGEKIAQLLKNMDRLLDLWPRLEDAGMDLRPEAGRWETIQAMTYKRARQILSELRPAGGLNALRAKEGLPQQPFLPTQPGAASQDEERWWWYLDLTMRMQRLHQLRRLAIGLVAAATVVAVLYFGLNRLFPVDPNVSASAGKQMAGQQQIQNGGDVQQALVNFQDAAQLTPNDPDAWIWTGVAQQNLGHDAPAQAAFARAQALLQDNLNFHMARAPVYLAFAMYDQGKADLDAIFAQDPNNPQAHYYLASLYEDQGNLTQAAQELEKVSTFAEQRQQSELTAISRYRLGMLLQSMQLRPDATFTPAVAPTQTP
jgi:cytochrome c-type biogenesis protein CcmH/NrfG